MSEADEALEWAEYAPVILPGNQPTAKDANDALEIAMNIRKFARTLLGLKRS